MKREQHIRGDLLLIAALVLVLGAAMGLLWWYDLQHNVIETWSQDVYRIILRR